MLKKISFDHIEVHVDDIPGYCKFLQKIFGAGRYRVIADNGISMFKAGGLNIEIKKKDKNERATSAGFCNPCLRMKNAGDFIEKKLGFKIVRSTDNPDGKCHFFVDHEGIIWHIKDYTVKDKFIDW